jgi:hypothetical protein
VIDARHLLLLRAASVLENPRTAREDNNPKNAMTIRDDRLAVVVFLVVLFIVVLNFERFFF